MTTIPPHEKTSECEACTLAEVMKDCEHCRNAQGLDAPRATQDDNNAMFIRLWGNVRPDYVRMQWDAAQEHGKELTDLCEGLHISQQAASVL